MCRCLQEKRTGTYLKTFLLMCKTRAALGQTAESLEDFNQAVKIQPDPDSYQQRGHLYCRLVCILCFGCSDVKKNFKSGLLDFQTATKLDHRDPASWNQIGVCYDNLGQCKLVCTFTGHDLYFRQ